MSTILKALKKLEQDKETVQVGGIPSGYMGPGSPHLQPRHRFGRLDGPLLRRSMVLLIILSLMGATFYFYRQSRDTTAPTSIPAAAQNKPHIKSAPSPKVQSSDQATSQTVVSSPVSPSPAQPSASKADPSQKPSPVQKTPSTAAKLAKSPPQPPSAAKPRIVARPKPAPLEWQSLKDLTRPDEASEPGPSPDVGTTVLAETEQQPREITPAAKSAPQAARPSEKKPTTQPPPQDAYNDILPLSDGRLKVQAIAWSPVVEDRMAVINARIVHEGDKVDGFLVLAIRHDDVVVKEKGSVHRVVFGQP